MRPFILLGIFLAGSLLGRAVETGPELDPRDYTLVDFPVLNFQGSGTVHLKVTFDHQGTVTRCVVLKTSATPQITAATVRYLRAHWHSPKLADKTIDLPFDFPRYNPNFNCPTYPTVAYWSHQVGAVNLEVTFDKQGAVEKCVSEKSTAPTPLINYTVQFIEGNWKRAQEAGKTIRATVNYERSGNEAYSTLTVWP